MQTNTTTTTTTTMQHNTTQHNTTPPPLPTTQRHNDATLHNDQRPKDRKQRTTTPTTKQRQPHNPTTSRCQPANHVNRQTNTSSRGRQTGLDVQKHGLALPAKSHHARRVSQSPNKDGRRRPHRQTHGLFSFVHARWMIFCAFLGENLERNTAGGTSWVPSGHSN